MKIVYWLYVIFGLIFFGILHASHNYSFEAKITDINLPATINNDYSLTHVLAEGCGCSEFVGEYLQRRGKFGNENIIAIGEIPSVSQLKEKGFIVKTFSKTDNALKGISGVPLFLVSKGKKILYLGGYDNKMLTRHTEMKDLKTLAAIKNGKDIKGLPIFGCANSKSLQKYFDPLGFKY